MKTLAKFLMLLAAITLYISASAQKNNGGFGFFIGGIGMPLTNKVETRLQNVALFGNGFNFNSPGLTFGGRGFGVFNRFMMGGGGYATTVMGTTANGEATLGVGAGFFNFGYMFLKAERTYLYCFGGIGGGGGTLEVKNTGPVTMAFAQNQLVPTGEKRKINGGGFGFEAGIGVQKLVMIQEDDQNKSAFMLGLIAGINYFPSQQWEFEVNETNVNDLGSLSSIYVGITIGGGGIEK